MPHLALEEKPQPLLPEEQEEEARREFERRQREFDASGPEFGSVRERVLSPPPAQDIGGDVSGLPPGGAAPGFSLRDIQPRDPGGFTKQEEFLRAESGIPIPPDVTRISPVGPFGSGTPQDFAAGRTNRLVIMGDRSAGGAFDISPEQRTLNLAEERDVRTSAEFDLSRQAQNVEQLSTGLAQLAQENESIDTRLNLVSRRDRQKIEAIVKRQDVFGFSVQDLQSEIREARDSRLFRKADRLEDDLREGLRIEGLRDQITGLDELEDRRRDNQTDRQAIQSQIEGISRQRLPTPDQAVAELRAGRALEGREAEAKGAERETKETGAAREKKERRLRSRIGRLEKQARAKVNKAAEDFVDRLAKERDLDKQTIRDSTRFKNFVRAQNEAEEERLNLPELRKEVESVAGQIEAGLDTTLGFEGGAEAGPDAALIADIKRQFPDQSDDQIRQRIAARRAALAGK